MANRILVYLNDQRCMQWVCMTSKLYGFWPYTTELTTSSQKTGHRSTMCNFAWSNICIAINLIATYGHISSLSMLDAIGFTSLEIVLNGLLSASYTCGMSTTIAMTMIKRVQFLQFISIITKVDQEVLY